MSVYKKIALQLHAVNSLDRQWVLSKLTEQQKNEINVYLTELQLLGIPKSSELIESVVSSQFFNDNFIAPQGGKIDRHQFEILVNAEPLVIYDVLYDEPNMLIIELLNIFDWSWRAQFISLFDEPRRSILDRASRLGEAKLTDKALKILIANLVEKIEQTSINAYNPNIVETRQAENKSRFSKKLRFLMR